MKIAGRKPPHRVMFSMVAIAFVVVAVAASARASDTPAPSVVVIAGSLQSEGGCGGDWDPSCLATALTYDASDDVWQGSLTLPAGTYDYKAALNGSWDENYGSGAVFNGPNIHINVPSPESVKFYYDHETHWVTDDVNSFIPTAAGSFQSEAGCASDWAPDCLRSWLEDSDGDGVYSYSTTSLPAGSYEFKVALNENWDVNYGLHGVLGGANVPFTVPAADTKVTFRWNSASKVPSVRVGTDHRSPVAKPVVSPAPNAHGWNNSAVLVKWHWSDPAGGSGINPNRCKRTTASSVEGNRLLHARCWDAAGNGGLGSYRLKLDKTPPTLDPSGLIPGAVFAVGQPRPTVKPGAMDALSGVSSTSCTRATTSSVGMRSVHCHAVDVAGNQTSLLAGKYYATDAFLGFAGVLPTSAVQGTTVPLRFALGRFTGVTTVPDATVKVVAAPVDSILTASSTEVPCAYNATTSNYRCQLPMPAKIGSYELRVFEKVGTGTSGDIYKLVANAAAVGKPNPQGITVTH